MSLCGYKHSQFLLVAKDWDQRVSALRRSLLAPRLITLRPSARMYSRGDGEHNSLQILLGEVR